MPSAVTKIATATPTSGTSTSFSTISGSYDDLMIIGSAKNDYGSSASMTLANTLYIQFNSDTGSNYAWANWGGLGAYITGNGSTSDTKIEVAASASYYSSNPGWGHFYVEIPGYKQTTSTKSLIMNGGYSQDNSQDSSGWMGAGNWNDTSAITDISLTNVNGSFITGTTITLYGISNS